MYQTTDPMEVVATYFGSLFGSLIGQTLAVIVFFLIAFVLWGLPWERLIAKAGFTGRVYWFLLGLFFVPVPIAFFAERLGSSVTELLGPLFGLSMYVGLLILAFCPWGVHRKLRQLKDAKS
jgi:fucose permease